MSKVEEKEQPKRIEWIDIARGIAIILVCLGHRDIPKSLSTWIYTFHIPVFFFLSGYVTKYEKYKNVKEFIVRKVKGLIAPYFSLGIVYIVLQFLYSLVFHNEFNTIKHLKNLLYGSRIGSSWFITCLICVEIICYIISQGEKLFKGNINLFKSVITVILCSIGLFLNSICEEQWVWNVNTAFVGVLFFEVGIIIRIFSVVDKLKNRKGIIILFPVIACSILCSTFNNTVDMWYMKYGNVFLFVLGAFSGIYILIFGSVFLEKVKILKKTLIYYGQNTLPIIFFHLFPGYVITETLYYKVFGLVYMDNRFSYNVEGFIHAITVLLLMIPVIQIINKFCPWMVGKKGKKKNSGDVK